MDELLSMQHSALQANLNKAANIQRAVTLTEANWIGLTRAMELTGNAILGAQEMETLLAGQTGSLTEAHAEAVRQIQQAVRELLEDSRENLRWMQGAMETARSDSQRESRELLREFQSQAGTLSAMCSSRLSRAEDTLRESARSIRWKMYLPTIALVLWELARYLFLRG